MAYGGSQARGLIKATAARLHLSPSNVGFSCVCDLITAQGNAEPLAH